MKTNQTAPSRWQKFMSGLAMFAVASLATLSFTGCGGSDDDPPPPPAPLVAPAAPTAFTAIAGADVVNLQWSPPVVSATAGQPASYEVYRSLTVPATAATLVDPANLVTSIPQVTGQTNPYSYADTDVQIATTYYYVVTAKNAAGETPSTVASDRVPGLAPGAPTAFTVTGGENVATLQWTPPAISVTVGLPDSYEIYRSTTADTATTLVDPANLVTTIADTGQTTPYSYTDLGLPGGSDATYFYVVTAKNADGETPSTVESDKVSGPPDPATYGNNFSAALIFADDIGIGNLALDPAKSWLAGAADVKAIDYNTGLRPTLEEVTAMLALDPQQLTLPYLPEPSNIDPTSVYYEQKSINTWQGEWAKASGVDQLVNAKWGDNLTGTASLSSGSKIRIEMVLTKDLTKYPTPGSTMTVYPMKLLSGSGINELQGTTGIATTTTTAFVFATNAHLTIHKLDADGNKILPAVDDQALFDPAFPDGGLNKLSAEIPVSGNFTYGYVWDPKALGATAGKYRLTFKLDPKSLFGVNEPGNNTFIETATNGKLVKENDTDLYGTEVYIDIDLK